MEKSRSVHSPVDSHMYLVSLIHATNTYSLFTYRMKCNSSSDMFCNFVLMKIWNMEIPVDFDSVCD